MKIRSGDLRGYRGTSSYIEVEREAIAGNEDRFTFYSPSDPSLRDNVSYLDGSRERERERKRRGNSLDGN